MPQIITGRQRLLAEYPFCYCCDRPKTSREHVPPLCFFPDEKDKNGGAKYRKNLIRVPSCDLHNTHKSDDDFYAAFHLASTIHGNHCAKLVRDGAITRVIEKDHQERGSALSRRLVKQIKGKVGVNYYGQLDPKRMIRVLELCARGVYFYERVQPLKLKLNVANLDFDLPYPAKKRFLEKQRESFNEEMKGCESKGSNPDVFKYAICEKPEKGVVVIEMVFYGSQHRWAFHTPNMPPQQF
jgi:hypothetical protein